KLKPTYVEAHANLGHTLVEVGRIDEGIEHLKTALASAPAHESLANSKAVVVFQVQAIAHNAMGVALALKGQMDQATKHLHEAVRLDPTSSVALRNLGNALAAQEQFDEAVKQYLSSLKLNDKDAETHVNLANTFMALGRGDEAMEHYRAGLR